MKFSFYNLQKIEPDGDCLFSAIAEGLNEKYNQKFEAQHIRNCLSEYYHTHKHEAEFRDFFGYIPSQWSGFNKLKQRYEFDKNIMSPGSKVGCLTIFIFIDEVRQKKKNGVN